MRHEFAIFKDLSDDASRSLMALGFILKSKETNNGVITLAHRPLNYAMEKYEKIPA